MILGVQGLPELIRWEQRLRDAHLSYETFMEPDRGNERTAIAIHPATDPYLFRNLRLL